MKRAVLMTAFLCAVSTASHACGLGIAGIAPLNQNGWTVDVTLRPVGQDIRRALDAAGLACNACHLPRCAYADRINKNKVMQIAVVPLSGNCAATVRWYDETVQDGVRARSREIMVLKQ